MGDSTPTSCTVWFVAAFARAMFPLLSSGTLACTTGASRHPSTEEASSSPSSSRSGPPAAQHAAMPSASAQ